MRNNEKTNKRLHRGFAFRLLLVITALCVVTLATVTPAFASPPSVTITSGVVIGRKTVGMDQFLGIPYAVPPVGALRWTPPQPYGTFPGGTLRASQFGSPCVQAAGGSENCLFLNVYAPASGGTGLPVMFWIHGGGLIEGSSNAYDPQWLVKQGVIVVTINYRLGYLGFFAQSAIDAEGHTNGNYGLMDQQLALQWVQTNIAAFGGNPANVTIFGQSAGGQSVYAQLASPTAAGMFSGAISESGSYDEFQPYINDVIPVAAAETIAGVTAEQDTAVPSGEAIAAAVGCGDPATSACLRAIPAAAFVPLQPFPIFPFVDGTVLPETMYQAFADGNFNKVPVISGTNRDEYDLFVAEQFDLQGNPIENSTEYDAAVEALFPAALVPYVLEIYSYTYDPTGGQSLGAAATDGGFSCPVLNANGLLSAYTTTYAYEFADENAPPAQADFGGLLTFPLGAYHASEVQYLYKGFDIFGLPFPTPLAPPQMRLSKDMLLYWTQFAKTGNPNVTGKPAWPAYNTSTDLFLQLTEPKPVAISSFGDEHLCSLLWNEIP
ncbi:MAG: carboxylesterase family protein [Terriglobales bacterium]